jgi:hypothetical protein
MIGRWKPFGFNLHPGPLGSNCTGTKFFITSLYKIGIARFLDASPNQRLELLASLLPQQQQQQQQQQRQLAAASSYGHISLEQQMEHARHFAASHFADFAAIQTMPPPPIAAPAMVPSPHPIASPAMVSMHTPQGFAPINPVPVSLGPQMSQLHMAHDMYNHQVSR